MDHFVDLVLRKCSKLLEFKLRTGKGKTDKGKELQKTGLDKIEKKIKDKKINFVRVPNDEFHDRQLM